MQPRTAAMLKSRSNLRLRSLAGAAACAIPCLVFGQAVYTVVDLGGLGGSASVPWGINAGGMVVGQSRTSNGSDHPFLWSSGGGMVDLGTLGGPSGLARAVTDDEVVVGWARNGTNVDNAFIWDSVLGMRGLSGLDSGTPSYAFGVNLSGAVVGSFFTSTALERAFLFDPAAETTELFPTNPYACGARGMNAAGQVVGFLSFQSNSSPQGFVRPVTGSVSVFGVHAWGINSAGQVVGEAGQGAFRWTPPNTLAVLPASDLQPSVALGVNASGTTVGYGLGANGRRHAFVFADLAGTLDLNSAVRPSPDLEITEAHGVNDAGQIAVVALDLAGRSHALVLLPPPTPAIVYVKSDAAEGGNGTSWATAYRSLQDALSAAAISGGLVHQIWVAQGLYVPTRPASFNDPRSATFQLVRNVSIYGGFVGTETSLNQRDWVQHPTVLSGDLNGDDGPNFSNISDNAYHVVTATLTPDVAAATLDGFTILGGNADGSQSAASGGGILCQFGAATFAHLLVVQNSAQGGGGAASTGSSNTFDACTFQGNRSYGGAGGLSAEFRTVIRGCLFLGNYVNQGGSGPGGVRATGNVVVSGCLISGNSAGGSGSGGGATIDGQSVLINCRVVGNTASGAYAGGVQSSGSVINCLINGNTARWGGGVAGSGLIANCTIVHNRALDAGGGLYSLGSPAASVSNCVLWGNLGPGLPGESYQFAGQPAPAVNFTCSQYWTGLLGGTSNFGFVPGFLNENGPDGIPGTIDDDLHLDAASSVCIDSGSNALLPADTTDLDGDGNTTEPLPLDLDLNTRRIDDLSVPDTGQGAAPIVDRGCYEAHSAACYPNCDGSTAQPVLNVNDFVCFLNRFAAGDPYANCDGSTMPPVLNVNDFVCFLSTFATGCR